MRAALSAGKCFILVVGRYQNGLKKEIMNSKAMNSVVFAAITNKMGKIHSDLEEKTEDQENLKKKF